MRSPSGTMQTRKTTTLVHLLVRSLRKEKLASMVFLQVHAGVEAGNLVFITIEHERFAHEDFAKAAFAGLAPARMIHVGIHVGVKAIFRGRVKAPGSGRLVLHKA